MCIVTADAGGIVIVSPATSASSRPGTATKGVQGFADDYRFGDNTQGSLFVRRKSQPAPRTTFGCVGGWKSEDPEAITGYPEESKSATPPPEESKLPERFLPEENVEPMEAAGAIEAPVDSKSMLLASLIETNRQPVQSSSAEQTADSGTGLTDAHPTTMAMVTSSSATEQHDKKSDRRTDAEAVDWRRSSSSDRFTYGGPSPSCASTSSSLVVAATATGQTGRVMGKKMNSPPIEVADMDVAVGVGEGEGQGTVGEVMPVTRSIRFGALPEGENRSLMGVTFSEETFRVLGNLFARGGRRDGPRWKRVGDGGGRRELWTSLSFPLGNVSPHHRNRVWLIVAVVLELAARNM